MASICLSTSSPSKTLPMASYSSFVAHQTTSSSSPCSSSLPHCSCRCSFVSFPLLPPRPVIASQRMMRRAKKQFLVCMAPEEEKLTRRNPLDFPIEWERPKPGRRPDIFPQFSPMKTPLPPPLPCDPPEEDEEEEEKKEEEEEDPEKEEEEKPDKQQ